MVAGRKVLVTGATGFIGGRLVEKLILYHGADVRALVRNFNHAVRIARFPVAMVKGDIVEPDAVNQAVAGCDTVFHCAHDFQNSACNLDGAQLIADACLRHKVRRLVYVSTVSVYHPLPDGDLDESCRTEPCGWDYSETKLAIEQRLLRQVRDAGLPAVAVQPTIVYGPFSTPWTVSPVRRLRTGRLALPSDRDGLCNAVYVDDVVDALILAAEKPAVVGERFLISGPAPVTWRAFYAAYEHMLGVQSVVLMPTHEIEQMARRNTVMSHFKWFWQDPAQVVNWPPVRRFYEFTRWWTTDNLRTRVKGALSSPLHVPDEVRLALYRSHAVVRIDKARDLLGYNPRFDFDRGMRLTAQFVNWANL